MINVAIDGPVGAGKSSVARECAKRLGIIYVDTGALYRSCALFCIRNGVEISPENEQAVSGLLNSKLDLSIKLEDGTQRVIVNGEDVSDEIRTLEISKAASAVSALPSVRAFLLGMQRDIASKNSVIMDGRDIGTVILPNADIKIFITAKPEIRAKRRYDELVAKGSDVTLGEVLVEVNRRDFNDMNRKEAPLKQAPDAILLDTSDLDFEQTVCGVVSLIRDLGKI
ncbi:MAG TPA: (d)CMP kinase [Ruminococcaceae bacterium]|nr:(d)CMP kinase [Oscillospiraceae bacterium]